MTESIAYGDHSSEMAKYRTEGEARAMALGNRGPIRWDQDGQLHPDIIQAYKATGFYVFTSVLGPAELEDLERDLNNLLARAPKTKGSPVDVLNRPALSSDCKASNLGWVAPLSDPVGGTKRSSGRHPVKMYEPSAPSDAPEAVLQIVLGSLQFSDAHLRLYGHPALLRVAASINGEDFVPFNEAIWIKHPHLGGSVAWHQDGTTQWDHPDFDEGTHGFNFMAQLYGCDATNGLWVVPGSHRSRADIPRLYENAGSDRLADAVPLLCEPGDVAICNRQAVHGSFANTSPNPRVTFNFGFHRRSSVLGVAGNGIHSAAAIYDEQRINQRSKLIGYAISARAERFPEEMPYHYEPLANQSLLWNEEAREDIADYNLLDLGI